MKDLLVILGILIKCFELYRLLRGNWIRRFLKNLPLGLMVIRDAAIVRLILFTGLRVGEMFS